MLSAFLAEQAHAAPTVDLFARLMAFLGVALSGLALLRLVIEANRKRAANVPDDLREIVSSLLNDLSGATQRPERILQLNTATAGASIQRLDELAPGVADRSLSRKVGAFRREVVAARITADTEEELTLTHSQLEQVQRAVDSAKKVLRRLDKLSRMAPG